MKFRRDASVMLITAAVIVTVLTAVVSNPSSWPTS
jgi:hypothetical protein